MKKKIFALALVVALLTVVIAGTTLAWLTATTGEVKNTFSSSDINITLAEKTGPEYKMVPGYTITKDPKVTVLAGSEACWLFVKLEESANFDTYMEYEMADGWEAVTGVSGVYARKVLADADNNQVFDVIKNDTVSVKSGVTKEQMNALTAETYPTLTVTAYATQLMKNNTTEFTAVEAWANVPTT